jgi:hypothetical protein
VTRPGALVLFGLLGAVARALGAEPTTPAPATTPHRVRTPAPPVAGARGSLTDVSGGGELDRASSVGGASTLDGAVLEVTQKGDRIWIQPVGGSRPTLLAEEVVVDGRSYEKGVGQKDGRRGTLTAKWGLDAKSLWLEVTVGTEEDPRAAVQRSVWRLSDDRSTWVRETITIAKGSSRRTRLVFRRQDPRKRTPEPETGKR